MAAYYNEFDPKSAAWLRELMRQRHIADGEVDERSILDVRPADLRGFDQVHFFAGIGGWSYALRLAGWPDDRPVWTGSPPCQPFSAAGKHLGQDDERLEFPVLAPLAATLKAGPVGDLAWVCNSYGRPFRKESFGNALRDACKAAGITGKSAHGLRKMLASLAAELGASEEQLQAWFGWQSNRMSGIYTRAASKKAMAGRLGTMFDENAAATNSPRTSDHGAGKRLQGIEKSIGKK